MGAWPGPDPLSGFDGWIQTVLGWLRDAANAVIGLFKKLWDLLWNHFLRVILQALIQHKGWLWTILTKIHDIIVKVRNYELGLFNQWFRPLLNFIQRLRAALLIFRVFHFKWAVALDQRLAGVENQLTKLWFGVLQQFNYILGYMNLIMNPSGLFRSGVYLWTAIKSIGQLIGAIHQAQLGVLGTSDLANQSHTSHLFDLQSQIDNSKLTVATGMQPDYSSRFDEILTRLTEMGYKVYP